MQRKNETVPNKKLNETDWISRCNASLVELHYNVRSVFNICEFKKTKLCIRGNL